MKLFRHGPAGFEKPGVIAPDGGARDLTGHIRDIDLGDPAIFERISALDLLSLPFVPASARRGPAVARVSKFIGIGLNYSDHAVEAGLPIPTEPVLFMKAVSCLSGPNDPIILPPQSHKTDWEVELGIVIGTRARHVSEGTALDYAAGFVVVNDVSEREYQMDRGGTWDKGKGCDSFGPVGPWLVTKDEVVDPQALDLWLDVNDVPMQRGSTANMIFSCSEIIAYLSRFMTLEPGDIITTGTPPGVGLGMAPPTYLKKGDLVTLGISGLGEQRQEVFAYES